MDFTNNRKALNAVFFADTNNGTIVGEEIRRTTDGGISWSLQHYIVNESLNDVYFTDSSICVVVGRDITSFLGIILRTTNGGITWTSQYNGTISGLTRFSLLILKMVWLLGDGKFLRTIDGGLTWNEQPSNYTQPLTSVYFTDINNGTAVAYYGTILRTIDGGSTWTVQPTKTPVLFSDVIFTDSENGWIIGQSGTILHTTNGGVTFIEDEENNSTLPEEFLLQQNYPNPFNPSTKISWQSPVGSWQT